MNKLTMTAACAAATFALTSCDRPPEDGGLPGAEASARQPAPVASATSGSPGSQGDTSVPAADTVLKAGAGADTARDERSAGGPDKDMKPGQESTAMPLPGQANTHSTTAKDAASSASAP